jgi:hypothetical protein
VALTLLCSSSGSLQDLSWKPEDLGKPRVVSPTQGGEGGKIKDFYD